MADLEKPLLTLDTLTVEVTARLELADAVWRAGVGERFGEALHACDEALALLAEAGGSGAGTDAPDVDAMDKTEAPARERLEAAVWLKRGHLLESWAATGVGMQAVMEALRGYDRAVTLLQKPGPAKADDSLLAGAWMNRGNALQRLGSETSRADSVRSYDRAIVLLAGATSEAVEEAAMARAVTLGAAWLNRGAACRRGDGEAARAEAARSFERAITELAPLADAHPAARRNLASAWTNLGLLRQENKDAPGAVAAHEAALRIVGGGDEIRASGNDLAALRLNLGQARRAASGHAAALELFRDVVASLAPREATDAAAADLGLRARHAACVTLGEQLAAEGEEVTEATRARLGEAATLVEEGLVLARAWATRGGVGSEPGARVFEFGAWLYRSYGQGQLAPYLQAHLEPADPWRVEIARAAVALARQEIMQKGFEQLMGEAAERVAAELADLREVEDRLRALSARFAASAKTA